MRVWVVEEVDPEGISNVKAVFSTEAAAEAYADAKQAGDKIMGWHVKGFEVDATEIKDKSNG